MKQKHFTFITVLLCECFFIQMDLMAQIEITYAKQGMDVNLMLDWNDTNYGDVQWQKSTDHGVTWNNIVGADSPSYLFNIAEDAFYRVRVNGDEACDPFFQVRDIRVVTFVVDPLNIKSTTAELKVSGIDFRDARIVEYGYCLNHSDLNRAYLDMRRVKVGEQVPSGNNFTIPMENLSPGTNYVARAYFKTSDGTLLFSLNKDVKTSGGMKWTTEDWRITQNEVIAKFELAGTINNVSGVTFKFGTSLDNLRTVNVEKQNTGYYYTSDVIQGLKAGTEYIALVEATVNSERKTMSKIVKTLSDYSTVAVDNTVKPVKHQIVWDVTKTLHRLSPTDMQAEYPRIMRVSQDTLLCAYHGGAGSDYWVNIYLQRSYDNGRTWTKPTILMNKQNAPIGKRYWRFTNPEMIKLKNGWVLLSFTANGNPETNENCHVMVAISKDDGQTWGDPIIVGRGRTWEPMIVQLPNGELELYVSSEAQWWAMNPRPNPLPQEILFSRSTDNGLTWTKFERAGYSPNRRDGMPVAVVLQDNKGILFSTEIVNDGGWGSPTLTKRALAGSWDSTPWNGQNSEKRWRVDIKKHGGAPYIIQLPSGEIILTAHAGGNDTAWQSGRPRILVGDNTGHNFSSPEMPLFVLPKNEGAYYNSLFLKDDETIWLLVTHSLCSGENVYNREVMYLEGKIVEK